MIKIRLMHSFVVGAGLYAITHSLIISAAIACIVEIGLISYLIYRLRSENEFDMDSFVGQLLMTYTINQDVGLWDMIHISMARVLAYSLFALQLFYCIPAGLLLILTMLHFNKEGAY